MILILDLVPLLTALMDNKRWNNYSSIDKYISQIKNNKSPIEIFDELTEIDKVNEIVGFGLRMAKGIDISKIPANLVDELLQHLQLVKSKYPDMIIYENNAIKLNQKGMQFADAIAVEMML